MEYVKLNNGVKMPQLGLGTFQSNDAALCEQTILEALRQGSRLIDTAQGSGNETYIGEALAQTEGLRKFSLWVPLMDRQIATAQLQLNWMVKDFKSVDRLMPKALFVDPSMVAIKIARLYMTDGDVKEMKKLYSKAAARTKYNGNVLLAAEMSWIEMKKGDTDAAFKTLTEALKKSDNETLKRNHECLMNNRPGHFSNSGIGDQWYSLLLEEPKVHVQRQRYAYR